MGKWCSIFGVIGIIYEKFSVICARRAISYSYLFMLRSSREQSVIACCCYLNVDPLRTAKGHLTLRALRLTPAVMKLYQEGDFSPERYSMLSYHCSA